MQYEVGSRKIMEDVCVNCVMCRCLSVGHQRGRYLVAIQVLYYSVFVYYIILFLFDTHI